MHVQSTELQIEFPPRSPAWIIGASKASFEHKTTIPKSAARSPYCLRVKLSARRAPLGGGGDRSFMRGSRCRARRWGGDDQLYAQPPHRAALERRYVPGSRVRASVWQSRRGVGRGASATRSSGRKAIRFRELTRGGDERLVRVPFRAEKWKSTRRIRSPVRERARCRRRT